MPMAFCSRKDRREKGNGVFMRLGFVRRKEGGMLSLCHSRGSLCLGHRAWFAEKIMTMLFLVHIQKLIRCQQHLAKVCQSLPGFCETGRDPVSVGLKVTNLVCKEGH